MKSYVGVTDNNWFGYLSQMAGVDEVNFWQPSADHAFRALSPGELFLFKLHSPEDYIVGGGLFAYWTRLPVSVAWDAFQEKNGAPDLLEMRQRIEKYRRIRPAPHEDYEIGNILLEQPFFFDRDQWFPVPDWHANIVRGKGYDLTTEVGRSLQQQVEARLRTRLFETVGEKGPRYGEPIPVRPRLGQGSFRILVTDVYGRQCAVTRGKALPVLTAAHIVPYGQGGEHRIDNGLLLRTDLHTLFDRGYVTITPDCRLEVSKRLRTDFDNGEEYFTWHGTEISLPAQLDHRPNKEFLAWHNDHRFVG
jgi:putative restriction endonuclease